jgi:hypothetical protein
MAFIKRIAGTAVLLIVCSLFVSSAKAAYIVTLEQHFTGVFATGGGSIDTTDLTLIAMGLGLPSVNPSFGHIYTGAATTFTNFGPIYSGYTGPTSFGSGGLTVASSGDGDAVSINLDGLLLPQGYVSGDPLSDTATYPGATFASLGVTPGTYVWTWGSGADADSFTLQIGPAAAPEPSSLLLLAGALTGFLLVCASRCPIA